MAATPISSPNSTELVAAFELKKHEDFGYDDDDEEERTQQ
jgi:hypothetical protein